MKFSINSKIFERVPALRVGVLRLSGINNTADAGAFFATQFADVESLIKAKFEGVELGGYPLIAKWREIYKSFGEKKARSSIEALIKRVAAGKGLYSINPLVDIYNIASLKFELPAGGEDADSIAGDLELAFARGDETFMPIGGEAEKPNEGEIIYRFGDTVVCRNFNYRESDITKLTPATRDAIIVFEDALGTGDLDGVMDFIAAKTGELLGAKVLGRAVLSSTSSEVAF